jgi:cell division protein FtsZ
MSKFATLDKENTMSAVLKVIGVGGGGCNAIESMIKRGLSGVEYIAVNTDAQVLEKSSAHHKIQIGTNITRGLGAGADPNVGRKAVEEDSEKISKVIDKSDMVFITAGMGGGTGTGASPIVAQIAKRMGALVIGIVTKPFRWEGKKRMLNSEEGIQELRQYVDSLIVIPNERILNHIDMTTSAQKAFDKPNEVLYEATRGIADIITVPGFINVDFADVRSVMNQSGEALMGCGIASGENRAIEAAQKAISSPLLEGVSIKGAKNILLNVTGSSNLSIQEMDEGNKIIQEAAGEEANIIFGFVGKEEMNEYVSYTVIATGFDSHGALSGMNNFKPQKEEKEKKSSPITGFDPKKFEIEDQTDLDVPTIFRVKGTGGLTPSLEQQPLSTGGFKIEKYDTFESPLRSKKAEAKVEDEDSSSFLRMMMD